MRRFVIPVLALLAVALPACGSDKKSGSDSSSTSTPAASTPATTTTEPTATTPAGGATGDTDLSKKPKVTVPSQPVTTLEKKDIVVGKGPAAKAGDKVSVQYVGVAQSTGKQFDASWDRGQAFDFPLGQGQVIPGWDEGIVGMKVGGRRQLTIPPDQAYGAQGAPPDIGPNETLVFVVDLLKIN
jgi:peptidylprolyl isomerase